MKKSLFTAFAALTTFAACTNDELVVMEAPEAEGNMITLDENFALGITRSEGAATRAQYDKSSNINWLPRLDGSNPIVSKVGLAWKGQAGDGKVYTNYLFEHFAFEVKNKDPKDDPCKGWTNLVFFTEEDFNSYGSGNSTDNDWISAWAWDGANFKTNVTTTYGKAIDPAKAYFKTENLTLFGGEYVAYMPYDETLINAGYLYAKSPTVFEDMNVGGIYQTAKTLENVADYHFYVDARTFAGGKTANGFDLKTVTGNITLKIVNTVKNSTYWNKIEKIAIYGPEGIIVEQAIDAQTLKLIPDAEATPVKKSTSLMANLSAVTDFVGNVDANATYYVTMTALPQTIKNATVVLFATDGSSAAINVGDIELKADTRKTTVPVYLNNSNKLQSEVYYVADMKTFYRAMTKAAEGGNESSVAPGTKTNLQAKIQLISDITYDKALTSMGDGKVWVNRDMKIYGGKITVPAGHNLDLGLIGDQVNVFIESEIAIEDACCGTSPAEVSVFGYNNNPTISPASLRSSIKFTKEVNVETEAKLTIGKDDGKYVDATFEEAVTNNGTLDVLGNAFADFKKTLTNNKTLKLENTTASANNNKVKVAALVNGENGSITVSKQTTLEAGTTENNGNLTILASGTGTPSLDGTVNVQASLANNGEINNKGVYNSNGKTTLNGGSKFVDYVGSQYGNIMPVMEGGDYICEVNTSATVDGDRLAYALNDNMRTTIVRFVSDAVHEYQLNDYDGYDKLADVDFVVNVDAARPVVFKNNNTDKIIVMGGNLDVVSAKSVTFNGNKTKIAGNFTVSCAATINNNGTNLAQLTVGGNLILDKAALTVEALKGATAANQNTEKSLIVGGGIELISTATMTVNQKAAIKVEGGLTIAADASATFAYSSYSDFDGTITNNGIFNRVLSSGSSNANPASVWCTGYFNHNKPGQINGAAQVKDAQ